MKIGARSEKIFFKLILFFKNKNANKNGATSKICNSLPKTTEKVIRKKAKFLLLFSKSIEIANIDEENISPRL